CRDYVREKLKLPAFRPNGGKQASEDDIMRAVMAAVMAQGRHSKPKGKIVETYNYTDEDGALLYQVVRLEPKSFRQRRPDGNGGWVWKLEDQRVLYRLPELKKFPDERCLSVKVRKTPIVLLRSTIARPLLLPANGQMTASMRSPAATL